MLDVDTTNGRRRGVEVALRDAIRSGRLRYGDALPSSRSLAADLGLSRATIVAAYEQLGVEGYVAARSGSQTTVVYAAATDGDTANPLRNPSQRLVPFDFHPGRPDLSGFPRRAWLGATRRVLDAAADTSFGYPDPMGSPELRRSLARYLARTRSSLTAPSNIIIVGGILSGLRILSEHFLATGHATIAVEDPMLYWHRQLLEFLGCDIVSVGVDAEGISVDALNAVTGPIDAVLVCPARHYPLGMTMSPQRRGALVAWARDRDALIIEDDYDGEFRYDGRPVGALQGLAPDRVVYCGTTSKTLAPGLRLGWLAVPDHVRDVLAPRVLAQGGMSIIDQLTVTELIDSGGYDRQVRTMRTRYRRRLGELRDRLDDLAGVSVQETAAGLNLTVMFTGPNATVDDREIESFFADHGVGVVALSRHYADPASAPPGLVIGFAAPAEHQFPAALDALEAVLTKTLSPSPRE